MKNHIKISKYVYSGKYMNVPKICACSIHGDAKEKVWKDVPSWAPVSRKLGMVLFKTLITSNYSGITVTICFCCCCCCCF